MRLGLPHSFFCLLFFFLGFRGQAQTVPASGAHQYTTQSVLSTGTWFKIGITNPGLYKLDKSFLQKLGLNPESTDPRNIKLYGNGGHMLPQLNSTFRPDDLVENSVLLAGEADGKFDNSDYLLFYAPGPHSWDLDKNANRFVHHFNIYSDTAYYFLTVSNSPGKRVPVQAAQTGATQSIDSFHEHIFHEQDLVNLLQSGRNWYGEAFNTINPSRSFTFPLPDLVPGSAIAVTAAVVGNTENASSFNLTANETALGTLSFSGRGRHDYHAEGEYKTQTYQIPAINLAADKLQINVTYNAQGMSSAVGYLDYFEIMTERRLKLTGNQTTFRSLHYINQNIRATYKIADVTSDASVWNITRPTHIKALPLQLDNSLGSFIATTDTLQEYLIFKGTDFLAPFPVGTVLTQNLHGLNAAGNLDLVILTHPLFKAAANKLALHRQEHDHLQVAVVTTSEVYNEFSSGSQDITAIRDFMRMVYQRQKKSGDKILHLLLLGDASYDYKSGFRDAKARTPNNTNFVPVYESYQSLDPLETYSSEDYYGLLDDQEGLWREDNFNTSELVDIGIGRLPVKTAAEAEAVINKIIHYDNPESFGKWRNQIALIADDGDNAEHLRDTESLATLLKETQPAYLVNKLYLDLFKQENVPNGQRSAATSKEIDKAVEQGSLILNYTGHGNETWLASEQILTSAQIAGWRNLNNLPFLLTATCEFGRYDDPKRNSGAEAALLNHQGGAIGLISTTRPVFASSNRVLNRNFMLMAFEPVNGEEPRLGDIMRKTKNSSQSNLNNRNFALLGDPSQRLAYPTLQATITHINGRPQSATPTDTLKALDKIRLAGIISKRGDLVPEDFNGKIRIIVFDKTKTIKTLGDENTPVTNIEILENKIFDGLTTVKQGKWEADFVVPKDISYQEGWGRVSLYASSAQKDAHGYLNQLVLTGTNTNAIPDNTPPRIKLYLNDTTFVPGGLTGKNPLLIARLFDENGINTSINGIGHEITAILDNDKSTTIILNSFYASRLDNFQVGELQYAYKNLSPGQHTITLKVWDTHNNAAEATLPFTVTDDQKIVLTNLKNYPNPVQTKTIFAFDHNQSGEDFLIEIQIFSDTGQLVRSLHQQKEGTHATLPIMVWDGRDENKNLLRNGIYLYRAIVRSKKNGKEAQVTNKLLLLK